MNKLQSKDTMSPSNQLAIATQTFSRPSRRRRHFLCACGTLLLAAAAAFAPRADAVLTGTQVPDYRGLVGTEFSIWDPFPINATPNGPHLPHSGTGDAMLTASTDDNSLFITGSGNLYTFSGLQTFQIMDTVGYDIGVVTFQTRTLGSELDYANVTLTYDLGMGVQTVTAARTELLRQAGFGATVVSRWDFNLLATGDAISSYKINFAGAAPSVSLDSVVLDTASRRSLVPDGGSSATMLALGMLGLVGVARRKK